MWEMSNFQFGKFWCVMKIAAIRPYDGVPTTLAHRSPFKRSTRDAGTGRSVDRLGSRKPAFWHAGNIPVSPYSAGCSGKLNSEQIWGKPALQAAPKDRFCPTISLSLRLWEWLSGR
jgi:hypothetical protein